MMSPAAKPGARATDDARSSVIPRRNNWIGTEVQGPKADAAAPHPDQPLFRTPMMTAVTGSGARDANATSPERGMR